MGLGKHTRTPWRIELADKYANGGTIDIAHGNTIIAQVLPANIDPGSYWAKQVWELADAEARANARRIVACVNACKGLSDPSAVPELLAALKGLLKEEFLNDLEGPPKYRAVLTKRRNRALDAIARAEGKKK